MAATRTRSRPRERLAPAAWLKEKWLTVVVHGGALLFLAWLAWRYASDGLGVDPVKSLYYWTGRASIILLVLSLTATPLYILLGWRKPLTVRRALGLYAALFAGLHFVNFSGLDYAFDLNLMLQDALLDKPYIVAGLGALLILIALTLTSTQRAKKALGRGWTHLHRLVYAAGALTALHFYWQAKATDRFDPLLYAWTLTFLLVVRIPPVRRWIIRTRQRLTNKT